MYTGQAWYWKTEYRILHSNDPHPFFYVENSKLTKHFFICKQDADLKIGQVLNVFGRNIVLTDCDKFTRDYYQKKYGIEEFVPIDRPKETRWLSGYTERAIPPYNGWGSFEDSEANCHSIQPKAPQRDMKKFLTLGNCNLRFKAQMISSIDDDSDREFIITYYLSDDTISIFEIAKRNFSSSVNKFDYKQNKTLTEHFLRGFNGFVSFNKKTG